MVDNFFEATGDPVIVTKRDLESLLDSGVGVAMVYGDLDYRCNCKPNDYAASLTHGWSAHGTDDQPGMGAENVSLSASYADAPSFRSAGYEPIRTNSSYQGGLVRQFRNFSFSRVFEAGHMADAYQPETLIRIFERAISGRDVATGEADAGGTAGYASQGPASICQYHSSPATIPRPLCFKMF